MTEHPTRFTLALRSAGDLPPDERDGVDAHLAECAACRAVASEIGSDRADYESRAEAERERLMAAIADAPREVGTTRRSRQRALGFGVAAAALAAAAGVALLVVGPQLREHLREEAAAGEAPDVAFKGALAVRVVARRGDAQFAVRPDDALAAGDALRFVVTAPEPGWIAVLSVEATGRTSVFYPADPAGAGPWPMRLDGTDGTGQYELPGSIILDDALGSETYVVVFSREPFSKDVAERAASALAAGRGGLPDGIVGRALRVRKVLNGEQ